MMKKHIFLICCIFLSVLVVAATTIVFALVEKKTQNPAKTTTEQMPMAISASTETTNAVPALASVATKSKKVSESTGASTMAAFATGVKSEIAVYLKQNPNLNYLLDFDSSSKTAVLYRIGVNGKLARISESSACCGYNGVTCPDSKKEGDGCTPTGIYTLSKPFGILKSPLKIDSYLHLTASIYWVDDPESAYYNQCVDLKKVKRDWSSAEHMIEKVGSYDYGMCVDYNVDPIKKGKGSAIFLHCGTGHTAGCVAVPKSYMRQLLVLFDGKESAIYIH